MDRKPSGESRFIEFGCGEGEGVQDGARFDIGESPSFRFEEHGGGEESDTSVSVQEWMFLNLPLILVID